MRFCSALPVLLLACLAADRLALSQSQTLSHGASRLEIVLEKKTKERWKTMDPGTVFLQNDLLRFRVTANFNGYLYVLNHGTSGEYTLLFPRAETGQGNRIEAGRSTNVPATEGSFRITGPPGHEVVYWLVSPVELSSDQVQSEYVPLPPPPKQRKTPPKLIPRCDDEIFRARGDCVDVSAGPQSVAGEDLPDNLATIPALAARELTFERASSASVVTAAEAPGKPVIFEFRIAHR
jgi:Domain of unknown function (DUF4384)